MKILFLIPGPLNISPGQRFRFEHYLPLLAKHGFDYTVQSFWSSGAWKILFDKGYVLLKSLGLLKGFGKRCRMLGSLNKYEYIFIYREAMPVGPPVFEWIIAKVFQKKIIYDFDDNIWLKITSSANPHISIIKCQWKVGYICRYSKVVSVGNNFLADYARQYNVDVRIIPTVVNTEKVHNILKDQNELPITIGWTGTFTNFTYLDRVSKIINELKKQYSFRYLIISDFDPKLKNVEYSYQKWNLKTEIADLLSMNIGIMPLYETGISLGKCGFKAIQYMSLGIPAVVSPVGVNRIVVKNRETGFWAESDEEWYRFLERLIIDTELRIKMGVIARKFIVENYSVNATQNLFLDLFEDKASST